MNDFDDPFPLLNVPVLVLVKILKKMQFTDLFILAQQHANLKQLIRSDVKRRNYAVSLLNYNGIGFEFIDLNDKRFLEGIRSEPKSRMKSRNEYDYLKVGTSNRLPCRFRTSPAHRNWPEFVTHWNDPLKGARELYKEINNLFSLPIYRVAIELKNCEENYKAFFRWLRRLGWNNIPLFEVHGTNVDFQAYSWVVDHAKPSEKLIFFAEPYEYFTKETVNADVPELHFDYGRWVSVDNLFAIQSKVLTVVRSTISAQDLNRFLHRFKEGSNPNLSDLKVVYGENWLPDREAVFEGLNLTQIDEDHVEWSFRLDNGDEGKISAIVFRYERDVEEDLTGFKIVVDRKGEEN